MTKKKYTTKVLKYAKKLKAINFLGGKCKVCGENDFFKLCFHHINSNEKENKISQILEKSWIDIKLEVSKCDLICLNCHYELHDKEINKISNKVNSKKIYLEYKNIDSCEKCGYNKSINALHFHHLNNKNLEFRKINNNISSVLEIKKEIENELNMCSVLCANCHNIEHSNLYFYETNKNIIINKSNNLRKKSKKIDREIVKKMYWNEKMKQKDIVKYFDCSKSTISEIIKELKNKNKN